MATLVLGLAGQAVGQAVLGSSAITLFGATISGATIGGAIGGAIGQYIDNRFLISTPDVNRQGPRLSEAPLLTSQEGAAIMRVFGRGRVAGQVIWASRYLETVTTQSQTVGGKGGGGQTVTETEYTYSVSFAVGLCEGPITGIGRIWADGKLLDTTNLTMRLYKGTDDQNCDAIIEAIEGSDNSPAYRGLAYLLFEDMPLADFGNRVPQIQVEIFRTLNTNEEDALEKRANAVVLTPGMGEFAYETEAVFRDLGGGRSQVENINNSSGRADVLVSIDQLMDQLEGLTSVSIVVTWFGSDLRCATCDIRPGVEITNKETYPKVWSVNGLARGDAYEVSTDEDGRPRFGGTPSDTSVIDLIKDLKARGLKVTLYPFIMMDVPPGNGLADPYDPGAVDQPSFPWRGRITVDPAPGHSGTPDGSSAADTQIASFFGAAAPTDFSVNSAAGVIAWAGAPDEWGLRRFILHYAHLADLAGGVDGFLIGSELPGITKVRGAANSFPAVAELKSLAGDVASIVGASTNISYAADWSEFFGHHPDDGSGDVFFHLDPLWADASIDMIAVDLYHPLADWRDGTAHLDGQAGFLRAEDRDYLMANIEGGEGYDWYYADAAARDAQTRTPISDGAYGKPWVYRYKDLRAWWSNLHYDRPAGIEAASPTDWTPEMKPFWFSEIGCPAVDKGANQPNVFYDPKSSESALPHYSRGTPNDLIQRRYLEALLGYWAPSAGHNPISSVYGGEMIDPDTMFIWTWDARPYPDFPARGAVWTDAPNWQLGHWVNGRLGLVSLSELVHQIASEAIPDGHEPFFDASALQGLVPGYILDQPMSPRAALEPLASAYNFDVIDNGTQIVFIGTTDVPVIDLSDADFVDRGGDQPAIQLTRTQEMELPNAARLSYIDMTADYRIATVESRKLAGASQGALDQTAPIVLDQTQAQALADRYLHAAWSAREAARFDLPPSFGGLEVGDRVSFVFGGRAAEFKITRINQGRAYEVEAVSFDASAFDAPSGPARVLSPPETSVFGRPDPIFLDLPDLSATGSEPTGYLAAAAAPWPGRMAIFKSATTTDYALHKELTLSAVSGVLLYDFYAGPLYRFDAGNALYVSLYTGGLSSVTQEAVLNGANAAAVQNADGDWEVLQFTAAELIGVDQYKLSGLLRGQLGTENAMANPVAAGARFVLLDQAIVSAGLSDAERSLMLNYLAGPSIKPISDVSYVSATHQYRGIPKRPFSPVHGRATRAADGSLTITWVRRTRISGDDWDQEEVGLGEASELYEIDIYDGDSVVRTLSSTATSAVYSIADQTDDFGGAANQPVEIAIFQISESFGRGAPGYHTLWI